MKKMKAKMAKKGKMKLPFKRPAMGRQTKSTKGPLDEFRKKFSKGTHEEKANTMEDLLDGESI